MALLSRTVAQHPKIPPNKKSPANSVLKEVCSTAHSFVPAKKSPNLATIVRNNANKRKEPSVGSATGNQTNAASKRTVFLT